MDLRRSIMSGLVGKSGLVLISFASAPALSRLLGPADYSIYLLIVASSSLFIFADLGVGQGLISRLAASQSLPHHCRRELISNAYLISGVAALAFLPGVWLAVTILPIESLLGSDGSDARLGLLLGVHLTVVLCGGPASLGLRVLQGSLQGSRANLWTIFATLAGVTCAVLLASTKAPLMAVVLSSVAAPVLVLALLSAKFFLFDVDGVLLRPSRACMSVGGAKDLAKSGSLFLGLNIAIAVAFQSDGYVASSQLGAESAAVLLVSIKVFGLVHQFVSVSLLQLWPGFADARARGDSQWISTTLRRSVLWLALMFVPINVVMTVGLPYGIRLLFGQSFAPETALVLALSVWMTQQCISFPMAMLMNGLGVVRFQLLCATCMAITNIPLSLALTGSMGVAGPVVGSIVTHLVFVILPGLFYVRILIRRIASPLPVEPHQSI